MYRRACLKVLGLFCACLLTGCGNRDEKKDEPQLPPGRLPPKKPPDQPPK